MQGAQRSVDWQMSCGRSDSYCATCGTQTLKQTPAAPLSDLHAAGGAPPDSMSESGTHAPPEHVARALTSVPGGRSAVGTQWAAPVVQQLGRLEMSIGGGGVAGTHAVLLTVPVLVVLALPASPSVPSRGDPIALGGSAHAATTPAAKRPRSPDTRKETVTPLRCIGTVLTERTITRFGPMWVRVRGWGQTTPADGGIAHEFRASAWRSAQGSAPTAPRCQTSAGKRDGKKDNARSTNDRCREGAISPPLVLALAGCGDSGGVSSRARFDARSPRNRSGRRVVEQGEPFAAGDREGRAARRGRIR